MPPWATAAALKAPANGAAAGELPCLPRLAPCAARAAALAKAVSNPSSAAYGRYLSAGAVPARFAPSGPRWRRCVPGSRARASPITAIPANRLYVAARGTVAQAETAFAVKLNEYAVQGHTLRAPASAVSIPASARRRRHRGGRPRPGRRRPSAEHREIIEPAAGRLSQRAAVVAVLGTEGADQPQAYGRYLPYAVRGYTPAQFRGAYGVRAPSSTATTAAA